MSTPSPHSPRTLMSSPWPRLREPSRLRRGAVVGLGLVLAGVLGGCSSVPDEVDDFARNWNLPLNSDREIAMDLVVGDCVLLPESEDVVAMTVVDCAEEHTGELMHRVQPDPGLTDYPGQDSEVFQAADEVCMGEPFEDYTGETYEDSDWDYVSLFPHEGAWLNDDRSVECILLHLDAKSWTGSPRTGEVDLKEMFGPEDRGTPDPDEQTATA